MIRIHPVFGESERNMPAAVQQSFRTDRAAMTDQTGEIILKTMGYIPQSEAGPAVDGIHGVIRRTPGNGGMSDGSRLILRAAVKPTSSIARTQHTVNTSGENTEITVLGRHDPVIVPRAVVVVESMTAITLADLLLQNMTAKMEYLKKIY